MEEKKVVIKLFHESSDGELLREYPELAKMEEFKDLDPLKVKFCWLVGNRTSPIFKLDREERISRALKIVWGSNYARNPVIQDIVQAKNGDGLPDEIIKGIYKMNTFNPSYRLKAKLMAEYIFEALNELIVVSPSEMALMDVDDKKKYADLAIKISSELSGMVERIESAYGVEVVDKKTDKEVKIRIDDIMY